MVQPMNERTVEDGRVAGSKCRRGKCCSPASTEMTPVVSNIQMIGKSPRFLHFQVCDKKHKKNSGQCDPPHSVRHFDLLRRGLKCGGRLRQSTSLRSDTLVRVI